MSNLTDSIAAFRKERARAPVQPPARCTAETFPLLLAGVPAAVTDRDSVIAVAGGGKRELLGKRLSSELEQIMEERKIYQQKDGERCVFVTDTGDRFCASVAAPIIAEGDVLGLVLFITDGEKTTGETEYKLAQTIAAFLGKHMEG